MWSALDAMALDPLSGDLRDLGDGSYRRRVGAYRIRFELDRPTRAVRILGIDRRTSTTYRRR